MTKEVEPRQVAEWMAQELFKKKELYQESVVDEIHNRFGKEFTYINQNGNWGIDKRVLQEFRKITEDQVVWSRGDKSWRFREKYDDPKSRMTE